MILGIQAGSVKLSKASANKIKIGDPSGGAWIGRRSATNFGVPVRTAGAKCLICAGWSHPCQACQQKGVLPS